MKKPKAPPTRTLTIRMALELYERLVDMAAGLPLGPFILHRALSSDLPLPRVRRRKPIADHAAYAKLLGKLGDSGLASNLNQLARQANLGTLPVMPETEAALQYACSQISDMRRLLVQALGLEDEA
ncbi:hypothetical protein [Asticcacaulis sp. AND118]|uniref:hypothetical protein n=1 Tax=Asticcacaulis sp. AND118 TaxID=2840468 RepID=UPI001CFF66E2|nr:hypothetical protein [Asticcacaulis sp. AND118]UDF05361.1 hypothetical protein LH365_14220 [Asticcacaulis sp. AND118]